MSLVCANFGFAEVMLHSDASKRKLRFHFVVSLICANFAGEVTYGERMEDKKQREAAERFAEEWRGRGYEKGESQTFWL